MSGDEQPLKSTTRRRTLIALSAVVIVLTVGALLLAAVVRVARETSAWSDCLTNLNKIGGAIESYAQDWDGRLPPADRWCDALQPDYLQVRRGRLARSYLVCPAARGPYSYAMNSKLSCAKLADIEDPSKVPLIFETTKTHRNAQDPLTSRRRDGLHKVLVGDHSVRGSEVLFADLRRRGVPDDEKLSP